MCFCVTGWMSDDKILRSFLVKLTVVDRDKFCLDIKQCKLGQLTGKLSEGRETVYRE